MTTDVPETTSVLQTTARMGRRTWWATLSLLKVSKTLFLTLALFASLALNVASLTVVPVFNALSSAIGAVTGNLATVRGKQAQRSLAIKKTVRQTTRRISGRVARATARSTGSIAAESIPYIGIGVILGVTAWEVSDACATMKDLHELEVAFNPGAEIDTEHTEVCGTQVPTKEEILQSLKESPGKAWDKAKEWASDLPSWDDAKVSAKDLWHEILEMIK